MSAVKIFARPALLAALLALTSACQSPRSPLAGQHLTPDQRQQTLKPVVAVVDFENLANFSGQWNLGRGMADVLVTELLDSDQVVVLERKNLGDVLNEIVLQGQELFRKEGKVERGRLKNAKFLFRGVITDFAETDSGSGWFGIPWLRIFGRGSHARVCINVKVSEVETGEIVASVKAEKKVSAGGVGAETRYKNMSFGGDAFFRTPLGEATEGAIRLAVRKILRELPTQYWKPCVAEVEDDLVVINGGENVRLRAGDIFAVREASRNITDPVTGNVIENVPGRVVGHVQVRTVNPTSAHAGFLDGTAERGQFLEPVHK